MIYGGQFYDSDWNSDDYIDVLWWCQSANNNSDINQYTSRGFTGQIALARSRGLPGYEGFVHLYNF